MHFKYLIFVFTSFQFNFLIIFILNFMLFFKFYSPEIFLTFSTILLLLFNTFLINKLKFKTPILNFEIFYQIFTILLILLLLLTNVSYYNIGFDFFFLRLILHKI